MLVLFETPAGFALFKVLDEGKLSHVEDLWKDFDSSDSARKVVELKAFNKFENTSDALSAATLLIDSKPSKGLRKFLQKHCDGETLAVADSKLGNAIKEKLKIDCLHNSAVMELMRGLRNQLTELMTGLAEQDLGPMSLGLSHSLSRYKLKFSPEKVDTMIIQAIGLLDDLDKELNTYAMRVREWYGWHFPELTKIVTDNIQYAKAVKLMGNRVNAANLDFSEILADDVEAELKEAAVISMGTEVNDIDLLNIRELCDQVLALSEYRGQLYDYLKSRMNTIAPNLTALVGELVGARLIAHGGSLLNLAKQPGSTIQILGAEKALFRALKTKHSTPKYGLIYHASLIGQAAPKNKGKISRSLAAKTALAIRYDALGDGEDNSIGLESRAKLQARLNILENKELGSSAGTTKGKPKIEVYEKDRKKGAGALITPAKTYNPAADLVLPEATPKSEVASKKRKHQDADTAPTAGEETTEEQDNDKSKKKKKKKFKDTEEAPAVDADGDEKKKSPGVAGKRGVCYLSRVPPHMNPSHIRQMLSKYGEVLRIYLVPEGHGHRKHTTVKAKAYSEGWIEFAKKSVAKRVANLLNGEQIGGKKRSSFHYDIWNIKYLRKFKWDDLVGEMAEKTHIREQKLTLEIAAAKKQRDHYLSNVEKSRALKHIQERRKKKQKTEGAEASNVVETKTSRPIPQKKPVRETDAKTKSKLSNDILAGVFGGSS